MKIRVNKEELRARCEEIIVNITNLNQEERSSDIIFYIIQQQTKRKYKIFGNKIKPSYDTILELLKDKDLVEKTATEIQKNENYFSLWGEGRHWLDLAKRMLSILDFIKHDPSDSITLTSEDEVKLLYVWNKHVEPVESICHFFERYLQSERKELTYG